ncbi:MAG: hypothetical protein R3C12_22615 [Planctomycetaceae bacterium]|nr:hypothetical protein [Planctomycetaceae bacterium]
MVSSIGRVMSVLVAMFSVAFMAFAISRWATIPDWASEARELDAFRLTRTEGETPSWSASMRRTEDPVHTSTNMAEVLEKMYQRGTQDAQTELQAYVDEAPRLQQEIEEARAATAADVIGVQNKVEEMVALLDGVEAEVARLTTDSEREKALAQQIQGERERRRADVFRLQEDLGQVNEDAYRAEQLQRELTDMIRRVQGAVIKLKTRKQQLSKSLE